MGRSVLPIDLLYEELNTMTKETTPTALAEAEMIAANRDPSFGVTMKLAHQVMGKTNDHGLYKLWILLTSIVAGRYGVSREELTEIVNASASPAEHLKCHRGPPWRRESK